MCHNTRMSQSVWRMMTVRVTNCVTRPQPMPSNKPCDAHDIEINNKFAAMVQTISICGPHMRALRGRKARD